MQHLDLFSGIGGFALATESVWPEIEHTFCDNDLFCQAVLKKHWPNSKIYGDIRTLTADTHWKRRIHRQSKKLAAEKREQAQRLVATGCGNERVDLLTGGFPCQPFSQAGRRRGTEDDRYLWPEMLRVIREFRPRWVIGENVGGLVTWNNGMVLEQVHADLESEGYSVQAFIIPAVAVNAPHRRDRVWAVAHSLNVRYRKEEQGVIPKTTGKQKPNRTQHSPTGKLGGANSIRESERYEAVGRVETDDASDTNFANDFRRSSRSSSNRKGMEAHEQTGERPRSESARRNENGWEENWLEVATRLCRVDDGLPKRMDRNPRLKALGNAIVPQVAEEIMRAIKATGV